MEPVIRDTVDMNIFVLHESPILAARYHCDKHVVKMINETTQLLATAHRLLDGRKGQLLQSFSHKYNTYEYQWVLPGEHECHPQLPLATHVNHPCALWARECTGNYVWLMCLHETLCREYAWRYQKGHAWSLYIDRLREFPRKLPPGDSTQRPLCMPDYCKVQLDGAQDENGDPVFDAVESYRKYYVHEKARFARWTRRPEPEWFRSGLQSLKATTSASGITPA